MNYKANDELVILKIIIITVIYVPNLETKPFFQSEFVTDFKKSRHHKNYDNDNSNSTVYVKTYPKRMKVFARCMKCVCC